MPRNEECPESLSLPTMQMRGTGVLSVWSLLTGRLGECKFFKISKKPVDSWRMERETQVSGQIREPPQCNKHHAWKLSRGHDYCGATQTSV